MRILQLAFAGADQRGVHRKLAEQVTTLRRCGAVVESCVVVDSTVAALAPDAPYALVDVAGGGFTEQSRAQAFAHFRTRVRAFAPDVVYMRYPVYDAHVAAFVHDAPPVVFELQTIYANEVPAAAASAEAHWASRVLPATSGLVAVTAEILEHELERATWAIPGHVMPNGADPRTIPFAAPELSTSRIDVLCVASFYPWHGVDRLIVGLAAEPDVQDVHLQLVGDGPMLPALRELVVEAHLESRVHFHGAMPVAALDEWYTSAHVAIGSLAPHRVGLRELAALKHREYVLRGLPMVFAGGDADFTPPLPWLRIVPADDSPVSPRLLRALAHAWSVDARRRQIRAWGDAHVSWDAKIPGLLNFLATVVSTADVTSRVGA